MMNRRENFLKFINHEPHEHIPCMTDMFMCGGPNETFENGDETGYDGFGLLWLKTEETGGQGTPGPNQCLIPDITEWEDSLKLPDLDAFDWEGAAKAQLAGFDRETQVLDYGCWNGPFIRFTHLLGFEDALCELLFEPECCQALVDKITDYRIESLQYIKKYFNPDVITIYDDVAASTGMFISPDVYEEIFSPAHKRFFDACHELGINTSIHICGRCEDIIPFLPEEGAQMWEIAEPLNDINGLSEKLGDRLAILGGISMTGELALHEPSEDELRAAAREAIEKYAPAGNYGVNGIMLYSNPEWVGRSIVFMNGETVDVGTNYYVDGPGAGVFQF